MEKLSRSNWQIQFETLVQKSLQIKQANWEQVVELVRDKLVKGFSYIHNFIIILSRVYHEPIQRPAPSWLVSLIGGALHRYRRGQGFESRKSLNFS